MLLNMSLELEWEREATEEVKGVRGRSRHGDGVGAKSWQIDAEVNSCPAPQLTWCLSPGLSPTL